MRVYDDHRAKAGVMRLTEYERRCGLCEQSVIKRKQILIWAEVRDGYLTKALIEHKSWRHALRIFISSSRLRLANWLRQLGDGLTRAAGSGGLVST